MVGVTQMNVDWWSSLEPWWDFLSRIDLLIGLVSVLIAAVFAVRTFMQTTTLLEANRRASRRREAPIRILLRRQRLAAEPGLDVEQVELPYRPRRDQLSRAELLGVLGLYYGRERFDPTLLLPILHDGTLNRVLAGTDDASQDDETLTIECPADVYEKIRSGIVASAQVPGATA